MAETKSRTTTAKAAPMKTAAKTVGREAQAEEKPVVQEVRAVRDEPELTPETFVSVRSGFNGRLVYKSKRTGERFVWEEMGSEQDMELRELKYARNANKAFFENNWFIIDDPRVRAWLGVERMYANMITPEDLEELIHSSPEEIEERIGRLTQGQKETLLYAVEKMNADRKIDSQRAMEAFQKSLGLTAT